MLLARRSSSPPRWLFPFAADEFAVPAQERLRRHQQRTATIGRKQPRERGDKSTVGRPQPRPGLLATEHGEFMTQCEQFHFAGERVTLAGRE